MSAIRGLLCGAVLVLCVCVVLVSSQDVLFQPQVDRVSARSARVRYLSATSTTNSLTSTVIQWTNASFSQDRNQFHTTQGQPGNDDHSVMIAQVHRTPVTSYILRNLNPQSTYQVRVGFTDTTFTTPTGSAPAANFNTPALSNVTALSTFHASGGCGQLTSDGTTHYLTTTVNASTIIYQCDVVAETNNVTITIVPQHAYASINTATTPPLQATNQTLSVTSSFADPLVQYTTTLPLDGEGTVKTFTWTVTSEAGTSQTYLLSVRRANVAQTAKIAGPTSPATAMVKSPSVATSFIYRGLTWQSTSIIQWKAWSDDLVTFPFSSLNVTVEGSQATLRVTPATSSVPDGSCSLVYVALFDQHKNSISYQTCISALNDDCSPTPFGAATKWQSPWTNPQTQISGTGPLYFPLPPVPFFPVA